VNEAQDKRFDRGNSRADRNNGGHSREQHPVRGNPGEAEIRSKQRVQGYEGCLNSHHCHFG
jgi:hypothetical protein